MQKSIHVDCPTYLELGLKNGEVSTVNGKELNHEGVKHVIDYLCQEVDVKADDVLTKVKSVGKDEGAVTLKLYNGAVSTF
ncbi:Uncharacterised protein [uncultured Eubacterium sp.]|uniref:hypothetical protein n=1 Tax=Emergencia sp. TaxID=1926557 RepID=UPI0008208A90|nr:Uncharacterised protein [uncultured Eubacterium sp.]